MLRRPRSLLARVLRAAQRVPVECRVAFVQVACRGDDSLAARVLAVLRAQGTGQRMFDRPLIGAGDPPPDGPPGGSPPMAGGDDGAWDPRVLIGTTLAGRYELKALVGHGSSGAVFEADDVHLQRKVAVKVFARRSASDDDVRRREVAALRGLALPGVVRFFDDGEDPPWGFVVMPLLPGGPFPGCAVPCRWDQVAGPAVGLLEGLARLHAHGVIHRDLKPANVLVDDAGRVTLVDVGASGGPNGAAPEALLAGTFAWMSPEQRAGQPADLRSDLYAFALLVGYALRGAPPDEWPPRRDGRRPSVSTLAPATPSPVAAALDRCLEPDPSARFADAHEVLAALRGALGARWDVPGVPADDPRPRTEAELRALFVGHDRLHHLREDAARELLVRTEGRPRAVVDELGTWERAGLVRREGGAFVIDRAALARLVGGAAFTSPTRDAAVRRAAPDDADDELLSAAVWAGPEVTDEALARIVSLPDARVTERLAALRAQDRLHTLDGGRHVPVGSVPASSWPLERQLVLRRRIVEALPVGAPGRLWNVAIVGTVAEAADEALGRRGGDPAAFAAGLTAALRGARDARLDDARLDRLLRALTDAAISSNDDAALEAAQREIDLTRGATGTRLVVRALVRAALAVGRRDPERCLKLLDDMALPDSDPSARDAYRIRLRAARMLGTAAEGRAVDAAAAWAATHPEQARDGAVLDWLGWRAFGNERFLEAAELHLQRARVATSPLARTQAYGNAAGAFTEALEFDRAEAAVRDGYAALGGRRAPTLEAVLEHARRAVLYRRAGPLAPDLELAHAALEVGSPATAAQILLNAAAVAWRAGATTDAVRLAQAAAASW
ncbi:MAG: protein kinase, partial [Planctomycetia bacterium]|nr:protein kinase [Planctomycetia bacterium]